MKQLLKKYPLKIGYFKSRLSFSFSTASSNVNLTQNTKTNVNNEPSSEVNQLKLHNILKIGEYLEIPEDKLSSTFDTKTSQTYDNYEYALDILPVMKAFLRKTKFQKHCLRYLFMKKYILINNSKKRNISA